jgi:hypothetical protein
MNVKKIILSVIGTVFVIYSVSLVVLLVASSGPSDYWQAFNPIYQHETWLIIFGLSLGNWGYVVMVIAWLLLFWSVYQFVNLFLNKFR